MAYEINLPCIANARHYGSVWSPTRGSSNESTITTGKEPGSTVQHYGYFRFGAVNIPSAAIITSAIFRFYVEGGSSNSGYTFTISGVNSSPLWTETARNSAARNTAATTTRYLASKEGEWHNANVKSIVEGWRDGIGSPVMEAVKGLCITCSTSGSYKQISGRLKARAPSLIIVYELLKSDGTLQSSTVAAGTDARLNLTIYNTAYSHKVTWKFGSNTSGARTVNPGVTYDSFEIPYSWLNAIPNSTSGTASVTVETLNGSTSLGSYTYNFTITCPSSVIPSIGSITAVPVNDNSTIGGWGIYVQGKSKVKLTINGAAGKYGSTIKSAATGGYSITTNPNIGSTTSATTVTTGYISSTGWIRATAKVTDSRGRSATTYVDIYVYPYASPKITPSQIFRSSNTGDRDDNNGTHVRIRAKFDCSNLGSSLNNVTGSVTIKQNGGSQTITSLLTSDEGVTLGSGAIAVDASYSVVITATDTVGTSVSYTGEIQSVAYILHIREGGDGLGIGQAAENANTLTLGWDLKLNKNPLAISEGGTGGRTGPEACANLDALSKSGGTMRGLTTFDAGFVRKGWQNAHFVSGSGDANLYHRPYRITIKSQYQDSVIEFKVIQRLKQTPSFLYLKFQGAAHSDPLLDSFLFDGAHIDAWIHKNTDDGINWDLYILGVSTWDDISIVEINGSPQLSQVDVSPRDNKVASLPSGSIKATRVVTPIEAGGTGTNSVAGVRSAIGISNMFVQAGFLDAQGSISGGSYRDSNFTFPSAFKAGTVPNVVACFDSNSTAGTFGRCCISVREISNTGFILRFFNGDSSNRNPGFQWIAMGEWP